MPNLTLSEVKVPILNA